LFQHQSGQRGVSRIAVRHHVAAATSQRVQPRQPEKPQQRRAKRWRRQDIDAKAQIIRNEIIPERS
jgi:hypothetical protein